jgi:NADP-dependent 3-hydroxy acid dehydrogenase YdfG
VALVARNVDALEQLATEIGNRSFAAPCDITDESAVRAMAESVENALGGAPDIIVNNAGIFEVARLGEMPTAMFTSVVNTNLVAPFMVLRAFVGQLHDRKTGHFVTIGSIADRAIFPENGAYAPAKYALRAMHEVLREELRGSGVRATLISPGSVDTSMWNGITFAGDERTAPAREMMMSPVDVAAAVVYVVTQPVSVNIDELRLSHS